MTVQATDRDEGANGRIRYEISSGNDDGIFRLDPDSGALYRVKNDPHGPVRLYVDAVDGSGKISGNQATVDVTFGGDHNRVQQFKFVVPEDISPYSEVGKVDISGNVPFRRILLYF